LGIVIFIVLSLVSSFFYWLSKLAYKRRLRQKLGREVADRELTSIGSWMEAIERDESAKT
jgi:hypothetical protein